MFSFLLYLISITSYFLHLPERVPFLGSIRFDFVLNTIILVAITPSLFRYDREKENTTNILLVLILYIVVTTPFVEWPGSVLRTGLLEYYKVIVFYVFTILIINTEKRLKTFIWVFIGCQLIRVIEPVYLHLTEGYWGSVAYSTETGVLLQLNRLAGAPSDIINPNQLAWVIVGTIPFLYYLAWENRLKVLFLLPLPVMIYALMLTGSRSGMIILIITIVGILFFRKGKVKRIGIGLIILVPAFIFIVGHLSSALEIRYLSVFDTSLPGGGTVTGRIEGWKTYLSTVLNKPFVGHGIGTSLEVSANYLSGKAQIAHNIYIETLQEIGFLGFLIFVGYFRGIYRNLKSSKESLNQITGDAPWLEKLANAILIWFVMNLVYGLACFGLNSWEWYLFGGLSATALNLSRQSVKAEERIKEKTFQEAIMATKSS